MESIKWEDLWPRHIAYGECEAWCGAALVVCITRPFTPDEDLVFDWIMKQDACELFGIAHLSDGRDLIVLDRMFKTQSMHEAQMEHYDHIRAVLQAHGVVPLAFSG
jgi:hypothetical protein